MKSTLKITSKGQVTLRKAVLDQLGVRPGTGSPSNSAAWPGGSEAGQGWRKS